MTVYKRIMDGDEYMVIGTFAYCGSGQDTLADGFCKYKGFIKYSLGDVIRNIAKERNLPQTREILQSIRKECDEKYGRKFIPETVIGQISREKAEQIIITGIRTVEEYEIFKERLGMKLIFVYANQSIRLQRMLNRGAEKDGKSISELVYRMEVENSLFDYEKLEKKADYIFNFEMVLENYLQSEEKIIHSLYNELTGQEAYDEN